MIVKLLKSPEGGAMTYESRKGHLCYLVSTNSRESEAEPRKLILKKDFVKIAILKNPVLACKNVNKHRVCCEPTTNLREEFEP